ncbi:MAG: PQQ-dependent sugar dehydrogenase, partial [Verrucomicrobia bacterium]|nr:PQQ-dependent sugar dehydrogenase [Verrucomicrobiota bacterium]
MNRFLALCWLSFQFFLGSPFEASATISTTRVATGLARPTYVTSPMGDGDRLFITEQHTGQIKILNLNTGVINPTPFLTVGNLSTGGDQGLLNMAFHPDYATNGLFYTVSSDISGDEIIQQFQVSNNPDISNPTPTPVLRIPYGSSAHYGSWIGFNPKTSPTDPQYLYMTTGDGNGQGDVGNEAQDLSSLFGKVLRIDVNGDDFPGDADRNYSIPANNPFVGVAGEDEIWAYGLRNPWRSSFDRQTGDLYIADVGWNTFEEINFQSASSAGGENY